MKKIVLSLLSMIFFASQSMAADVVKVNEVVAKILNEIVANDDFVESLELSLDQEKTSLEKPSIGVSLSASTKQAAWSTETTSLVASLEVDTEPVSDEQVRAFGSLAGSLETDFVSFSKYVVDKDVCNVLDFSIDVESAACATLVEEIKSAENFLAQVKAISKAFDAFKVEIKTAIKSLKAKQEAETDENEKEYIQYDIDDLEQSLKVFEGVVISEQDGSLSLTASLDDVFGEDDEETSLSLDVQVTESALTLSLNFSFVVDQEDLAGYSSIPAQIIMMLEQDSPESNEFVTSFALGYIDVLKELVTDLD